MAPICLPAGGLQARRRETGGQRRLQAIENDALATHLLSADKKLFTSRISPASGHEARFRAVVILHALYTAGKRRFTTRLWPSINWHSC